MNIERKSAAAWVACCVWMALIFVMSAMPAEVSARQSGPVSEALLFLFQGSGAITADRLETIIRKGAHIAEYAVLFLLNRRALRLSGVKRLGRAALLMTAAYAVTDEIHQYFVPGRAAQLTDVGIDICGAFLAWGISALFMRRNAGSRCGKESSESTDTACIGEEEK